MQWVCAQPEFRTAIEVAVRASRSTAAQKQASSEAAGLARAVSKSGTRLSRVPSCSAITTAQELQNAAVSYVAEARTETESEGAEAEGISDLENAELLVEAHFGASNPNGAAATRLLNLARQWVCNFLPHCLARINRVP